MRLFLLAHSIEEIESTSAVLQLRGYDVRSGVDAMAKRWQFTAHGDLRHLLRSMAYHMLAAGVVVLHDQYPPEGCASTMVLCRLMGIPIVEIQNLPAIAPIDPAAVLMHDLNYTGPTEQRTKQ